jgi:uncharacterized oxidoreductase
MLLDGKKALVTGGAAGLGLALSMGILAAGGSVIVCGRNESQLRALCDAYPGKVAAMTADLTDPAVVQALVANVKANHPDLSLLINNAGVQRHVDFFEEDPGDIAGLAQLEIEVNFSAIVALCAGLIPILRQNREAAIVNITSGLAVAPKKTAPVYCASKAALRTFTKALRYQAEDAKAPLAIIDVIMTLVDTGMTAGRGKSKISPEAAAREVLDGIRSGRNEIWVGKTKMLRWINRLSPALSDRLLRDG